MWQTGRGIFSGTESFDSIQHKNNKDLSNKVNLASFITINSIISDVIEMTTVELYYSDTCHNCHQVRAMIMELLPKTIKFKEINTSYPEGKKRAEELDIMSVPVVAIDGEVILVGRISREELLREINIRMQH